MASGIWVNIGSGNGLLPDGTKPLPEPMLTDHLWSPVTFILGQFHKRCFNHQSLKSIWNYKSKISFKFPWGQWVKSKCQLPAATSTGSLPQNYTKCNYIELCFAPSSTCESNYRMNIHISSQSLYTPITCIHNFSVHLFNESRLLKHPGDREVLQQASPCQAFYDSR